MIKFQNFKKTLPKTFIAVLVVFFIVILAVFPERYIKVTLNGITLWAVTVLPSLLPYFFFTALLTELGVLSNAFYKLKGISKRLFGLGGISIYAFCMSVLSGYPLGSKLTKDLYLLGDVPASQTEKLALLCSTSGPLFIIGAVGVGMFNNKIAGLIIYLSHVLAVVLTSMIIKNFGGYEEVSSLSATPKSTDNILGDAVYGSVTSVLTVGGFIAVFYVISQILIDFRILTPVSLLFTPLIRLLGGSDGISNGVAVGLIEFTKGCKMLSQFGLTPLTLSLCAFLITLSGVSVIAQSLCFLSKAKVNALYFIAGKLFQGVLAFLICYGISSFIL